MFKQEYSSRQGQMDCGSSLTVSNLLAFLMISYCLASQTCLQLYFQEQSKFEGSWLIVVEAEQLESLFNHLQYVRQRNVQHHQNSCSQNPLVIKLMPYSSKLGFYLLSIAYVCVEGLFRTISALCCWAISLSVSYVCLQVFTLKRRQCRILFPFNQ